MADNVLSLATTSDELPEPQEQAEVGYALNLPFVGSYRDAWEVFREEHVTVEQLVAMRRTDGQARALYRLIVLPIRAALNSATFTPAEGEEGGEEEAEFAEAMLTLPPAVGGMLTPFPRFVAEVLQAVFDGFAAHEMSYQVAEKGPLKGKVIPWKLGHRPAETLTFLVDKKGEFAGFRQRASIRGEMVDVEIGAEHAIYWAANEEERPFYGVSYFQSAFYHWDKKIKLYYIAHLAAQRAAVGTRVGTIPKGTNKADVRDFKKALSELGVAQWISAPDGYTVESLKEGGSFDFLAMVNHHNSQMSKSVLAQFFDKEQGAGSSERTMVDFGTQSDAMFILMLETIMDDVASLINDRIIPRFIDWNFGSGKYPKFHFGPLTTEQKRAVREVFEKLAAGETKASPEFILELEKQLADEFGLEIDYEAVEARMEEERIRAQETQEALLEVAVNPPMPPAAGGVPGSGKPSGAVGARPAGSGKTRQQQLAAAGGKTGAKAPTKPRVPRSTGGTPSGPKAPDKPAKPKLNAFDDEAPIISLSEMARELLAEALELEDEGSDG